MSAGRNLGPHTRLMESPTLAQARLVLGPDASKVYRWHHTELVRLMRTAVANFCRHAAIPTVQRYGCIYAFQPTYFGVWQRLSSPSYTTLNREGFRSESVRNTTRVIGE